MKFAVRHLVVRVADMTKAMSESSRQKRDLKIVIIMKL